MFLEEENQLITVKDTTFDREKFKETYEILENFLFTQKLLDVKTHCSIDSQGGFFYAKTHVVTVLFQCNLFQPDTINKSVAFRFSIYSDQCSPSKALFEISIRDQQFNARKMMGKLKRLGFTSWSMKKELKTRNSYYKIYCYNSPNQLQHALTAFAEYLP